VRSHFGDIGRSESQPVIRIRGANHTPTDLLHNRMMVLRESPGRSRRFDRIGIPVPNVVRITRRAGGAMKEDEHDGRICGRVSVASHDHAMAGDVECQ
jgi:hypothetical protein